MKTILKSRIVVLLIAVAIVGFLSFATRGNYRAFMGHISTIHVSSSSMQATT